MKKLIFSGITLLAFAMFFVACGSEAAEATKDAASKVASTAGDAAKATANAAKDAANATKAAVTPAAPAGPTTSVEFKESTFDFGKVDEGEKVSHTYAFSNTGKEPLIISNAKGSCGCTVPKWPKEPIPPGGTGEVTVEFNSKNKKGKRNQKVTLTANTEPAQTFIYLTGEVIPDPNAPAPAAKPATPQIQVNQ